MQKARILLLLLLPATVLLSFSIHRLTAKTTSPSETTRSSTSSSKTTGSGKAGSSKTSPSEMRPDKSKSAPDNANAAGFALVELFTSEGCSSCPPADELAARIASEYKWNVYVLCYHVDYWDKLGWKDIYSNAEYTQRQKEYAQEMFVNSVYTPQAIINGREQLVGSNEDKMKTTIMSELEQTKNVKINLKPGNKDAQTITLSYEIEKPKDAMADVLQNSIMHVALVQMKAYTQVQGGENQGKKLKHINIVRDFKSIDSNPWNGSVDLSIPQGLTAKDCKLFAFLQDRTNMHILAAGETGLK